jgi:uncharacterized protein (DUF1501 family)
MWAAMIGDPVRAEMFRSFGRFGAFSSDSAPMSQTRRATAQTERLREQLAGFADFNSPVSYPDSTFGHSLAGLAAMLGAGLPVRCVAVNAYGSYDTHSDQAGALTANLRQTCDGLLAFQRDLEARGLQDRVLIEMWSEFGRRPQENGSAGTDHGAAGCAFVIGNQARGQMVGEFPGLATLDSSSNLRSTSDFRAMYCSLLEQWLGQDAGPVVPGASGFDRPALVKG